MTPFSESDLSTLEVLHGIQSQPLPRWAHTKSAQLAQADAHQTGLSRRPGYLPSYPRLPAKLAQAGAWAACRAGFHRAWSYASRAPCVPRALCLGHIPRAPLPSWHVPTSSLRLDRALALPSLPTCPAHLHMPSWPSDLAPGTNPAISIKVSTQCQG